MSGSLPALQQHAESTAEAFCQRYVQPPKKKLRRGRVRLSRCDSTSTHSQRQKPGNFYRPRDHEASPFFKVVRDNFDKFEDVYPERYQERYGYWRPVIRSSIDKFLKCGDLKEGLSLRSAS